MLQHLITHFSLRYREAKSKGQFQTFSSKNGRGPLRERGGRLQEVPNIAI